MKSKLKLIFLLAMLIWLAPAVLSLEVKFSAVQNQIYLDENARFMLELTNDADSEEIYQIYTNNIAWHIDAEPSNPRLMPGESINVSLELLPSAWATTGPQRVNIFVEGLRNDEVRSTGLSVYVKDWSVKGRSYAPSIELRVNFEERIDPRASIPVEIYLRNRNRLDITDLVVRIQSELFSNEHVFNFSGLEERSEEYLFEIDPLTPPQEDTLVVSVLVEGEAINEVNQKFQVLGYSEFVEETDSKREFFKTIKDIDIVNQGNVESSKIKRIEVGFFESIFTKALPRANKETENRKTYMSWNVTLEPMQAQEIRIVTNYRPLIYLAIISILVVAFYYLSRSPVIAKKEALIIGSVKSGISEMKVLIYVKNRTSDIISNVRIVDKIPSLAALVKESYLGTLEPNKILTHDKKGTIVKWDLKSLEPFEERVIAYRIKSKLNIIGGISLPPVKIKFETKKGKERIVFSDNCEVRSKQA